MQDESVSFSIRGECYGMSLILMECRIRILQIHSGYFALCSVAHHIDLSVPDSQKREPMPVRLVGGRICPVIPFLAFRSVFYGKPAVLFSGKKSEVLSVRRIERGFIGYLLVSLACDSILDGVDIEVPFSFRISPSDECQTFPVRRVFYDVHVHIVASFAIIGGGTVRCSVDGDSGEPFSIPYDCI